MLKKNHKKIYGLIIITVLCICIIILMLYVSIKLLNKKSTFKLESKLDSVASTVIGEDNQYKTVGWVKIEGTNIDLPIIKDTKGHNYPAEYEGYAWIDGVDTKMHNINFIKGHNIFNLSSHPMVNSKLFKRFEDLMAFTYYDFAKENNYFQITLDNKEYVYQIFNYSIIPNIQLSRVPDSLEYSKDDMNTFLKFIDKFNIYDYSVKVKDTDNIVVLSTCTRMYGVDGDRTVWLVGKRLNDKDNLSKVRVRKNEKYNEIEKLLKGEK